MSQTSIPPTSETPACYTILVCGGRDYADGARLSAIMTSLLEQIRASGQELILVEGGARGADRLARLWAVEQGVRFVTYEADWAQFGSAAGLIRNQKMLTESHPDMVVAFPGGRGTADMITRAKRAGVRVEIVKPKGEK